MSTTFTLKKQGTPIKDMQISQSDFDANGEFLTDEFNIQGDQSSVNINIEYKNMTPDRTAGVGYEVIGFLETQINGGSWHILAASERGHSGGGQAEERSYLVEPGLVVFDEGVDISIFSGSEEISRVTKRAGRVADALRVRFKLIDRGNQGSDIQNIDMTVSGILYN